MDTTPDEECFQEDHDVELMSDDGDTDESDDEFVLDSDEEQNCDSDDDDDTNDENTSTKNFVW